MASKLCDDGLDFLSNPIRYRSSAIYNSLSFWVSLVVAIKLVYERRRHAEKV